MSTWNVSKYFSDKSRSVFNDSSEILLTEQDEYKEAPKNVNDGKNSVQSQTDLYSDDSILTKASEIVKVEKSMLSDILNRLDRLEGRIEKVQSDHAETQMEISKMIKDYERSADTKLTVQKELRSLYQKIQLMDDAKYGVHD